MITLKDYFRDFRERYPLEMSPSIEDNAVRTVELVGKLLARALKAGVSLDIHPETGSYLSSGWRPPSYNATVKNAATKSKHMTGEAADIFDPNDGDLDNWLMSTAGQRALIELGLWHEHPSATKGWAHVQTKPPKSGRRTFFP